MLKVFKPITDLTGQISGMLQGARGFMDKAGGQGFRGVVREAFDFNATGYVEEADRRIGRVVLHLTMADDSEGVETVLRFRNYAVSRIEEFQKLNELSAGSDSNDPDEIRLMVDKMAEFLESREPEVISSDREETLRQEIAKLRQMNRHLSLFLENEEALLEEEDRPAKKYPVVGAPRDVPTKKHPAAGVPASRSGKKYPVAGKPAKKPAPVAEEKAEE